MLKLQQFKTESKLKGALTPIVASFSAAFVALTGLISTSAIGVNEANATENYEKSSNEDINLYEGLPSIDQMLKDGTAKVTTKLPKNFGSDEYLKKTYNFTNKEAKDYLAANAEGFDLKNGNARAINPAPSGWYWEPNVEVGGTTFAPVIGYSNMNPTVVPAFCMDLDRIAPNGGAPGNNTVVRGDDLTNMAKFDPPERYNLISPEISLLLVRHGTSDASPMEAAALAVLVHANFELAPNAQQLVNAYLATWESNADGQAATRAAAIDTMVSWARNNTTIKASEGGWPTPVVTYAAGGSRTGGVVSNIAAKNKNGGFIAGLPYTVTLIGPGNGKFPNGTNTISGITTTSNNIIHTWEANNNGNVEVKVSITFNSSSINLTTSDDYQRTVTYDTNTSISDPPTTVMNMALNFQPILTSDVSKVDSKVVNSETEVLKDHLTVSVDQTTPQLTRKWIGLGNLLPGDTGYAPLPVKFKGTAYYVGDKPVAESDVVPANAIKVGETSFIATGEGEHSIETKFSPEKALPENYGFITWVWEVDKTDQPQITSPADLEMIYTDWADGYSRANEITSITWPGEIETQIKVVETNNNTYLVDDVFVSKLPVNHPDFEGGFGFRPDYKVIYQDLYFWEKGVPPTSLETGQLIGTVEIPAKNGFYPSVGSNVFKVKKNADGTMVSGTYQFVHRFPGDDRVDAFVSQLPDVHEQYVVPEPEIKTQASAEDGSKIVSALEKSTIVDKVTYSGLKIGEEYVINGKLINKATGEPILVKDKEVVATAKFTPKETSGVAEVIFEFDARELGGITTVVFEDLTKDGISIAVHADINDEGQTVYIPKIGTEAKVTDGSKTVSATKEATLVDTVKYENLIPGKKYTLNAKLMDKKTEKVLMSNGKEVSGSVEFTPTEANGTVDVEFKFDASLLGGTTTVVFEDLLFDGRLIATHSDINDEGQTVYIPSLKTTATGKDGSKNIVKGKDTVINDKVCYTGLTVGRTYDIKGTLMDKTTGKAVQVNKKDVVATSKVTPTKSDDCTNITFKFDSTGLSTTQFVVFENVYDKERLVAVHADINDKDQTVGVNTKTTSLEKTGLDVQNAVLIGGIALLGIGALLFVPIRNKLKKAKN